MADKKIVTSFGVPVSETRKDQMADKVNVPRGAALPLRDANGKLIGVVISLPEAASENARDVLANLPETSAVIVTDIVPGTEGWAGDAASLAALVADGAVIIASDTTVTDLEDGTSSVLTDTGTSANWDLTKFNAVAPHPLPSNLELKFKFTDVASSGLATVVQMVIDNGNGELIFEFTNDGSAEFIEFGQMYIPTPFINDTEYHIVKVSHLGSPTNQMQLSLDGEIIGTGNAPGDGGNQAKLNVTQLGGTIDTTGVIVDYLRWTEWV